MRLLHYKSFSVSGFLAYLLLTLGAASLHAQTFRGGINGTVTDQSGAAVPGAIVETVNDGTGVSYKAISSSGGEFVFQDLPLATYTVNVTASGFETEKIQGVPVSAGVIYTLPVRMRVASAGETVEVSASALALDTTSTVQTTDIPSRAVQDTPMNGRDFTQLIALMPGYAGYSGGGYGSVNGARPDMTNWQIEGADNNDVWWNVPAANQGGISGIAGVTLPLDAIDEFSVVTQGSAESGRNPGAVVNMVIKSGTNQLHGSAYYYNRNEALAAQSALSPTKPELRNQQFGFSAGGPIWRDKFFWFVTYEEQKFIIGVNQPSTEPSAAYQTLAMQQLTAYGVPVNQTALNLLHGTGSYAALWPAAALTGPATPYNYTNPANETGLSHNGLAKLDYVINQNNKLSFKWYVGQGPQIAPTTSLLTPYYEVGPMHVQNYSLALNTILSSRMANQVFAGVNYFNQSFSDQDTSFNPIGLGLNTGVTSPSLAGAPRIQIASPNSSSGLGASASGFDFVGATVRSGRNDITGHLDEALSWTVGKHEFRFGGEFRQSQLDDFYQSGQRGTFVFDGTQGPWANAASPPADSTHIYALADFLAGYFDANDTNIVQGDPKRQVFVNSFALFAQDAWQLSPRLNVNYGLRYEYNGPMHSDYKDLTTFLPGAPNGIATVGDQIPTLYPKYWSGFGPRLGASWSPGNNGATVLRAAFGLGFDSPNLVNFLNSRFSSNGGPFGVQDNPAGSSPVVDSAPVVATLPAPGGLIFANESDPNNPCIVNPNLSSCPSAVLFSVSQKLRPGYVYNYNFNLQQSLSPKLIAQLGYVGSQGRRLRALVDINQAGLNSGGANSTRPYYSQYPNYGVINQIQGAGTSNYNALQGLLRFANWHGVSAQSSYTWAHTFDEQSQMYLYNPQNSFCFKCDYGNSDFDVRNTFSTYVSYNFPNFTHGSRFVALATNGWQLNSLVNLHSGPPFSIYSQTNPSGTGEDADRASPVSGQSPLAVSHTIQNYQVNWVNPAAFVDAPAGTYGTSPRNQLPGPGFADVDFSVFKNTHITERVTAQFRVEMFNLFNHLNLAAPGDGYCTDGQTCPIGETIGTAWGAPGIGAGEPFNTQLALKIIF
jgi:hypothetical protein